MIVNMFEGPDFEEWVKALSRNGNKRVKFSFLTATTANFACMWIEIHSHQKVNSTDWRFTGAVVELEVKPNNSIHWVNIADNLPSYVEGAWRAIGLTGQTKGTCQFFGSLVSKIEEIV